MVSDNVTVKTATVERHNVFLSVLTIISLLEVPKTANHPCVLPSSGTYTQLPAGLIKLHLDHFFSTPGLDIYTMLNNR